MNFPRLALGPRLSTISWHSIELFLLLGVFFLPFSKSAVEIFMTVALALWLLRKMPWNERFPNLPPCNIAYGVFLAAALVSIIQIPAGDRVQGITGMLKWLQYLGIFFMGTELFREPKRRGRLVAVFLASMTLVGLNGLTQMIQGEDLVRHYSADKAGRLIRMTSSFLEPNGLAAFMLFAVPLSFFAWVRREKWGLKSVLSVAVFGLLCLVFTMTLSRGAFFALLISVLLYLIFKRAKWLIVLMVLSSVLFLFSSAAIKQNFVTSLRANDITIGERMRSWETTWKMVLRHPLTGNGVGRYYALVSEIAPEPDHKKFAQNSYLRLWSEIGLIGLLAFLWPAWAMLSRGIRSIRTTQAFTLTHALVVGALAFFLQSLSDSNFFALQTSFLFWPLWAMLAALVLNNSSES